MRYKFILVSATLAIAGTGAFSADAAPVGSAIPPAPALIEKTQFYWQGQEFCFYNDGWRGAGWYRCGYEWRRGYGWGGPRGWNNWRLEGGRDWDHRRDWREHRDWDRRDWDHRRYHDDDDEDYEYEEMR